MWRFENFDEAERAVNGNVRKIGYVKVFERVRGPDNSEERSEPIGRFDIPNDVLGEAIKAPGPNDGPDDSPDDAADDQEQDDAAPSDPVKRLVYDVLEWTKGRAVGMMAGRARGKFQLRGFSRAGKYVCSAVFMVINTDLASDAGEHADDPQHMMDSPPEVPPLAAGQSAQAQAYNDLALAYSQFLFKVAFPAMSQVVGMSMQMNHRLMAQNLRLDTRVQGLVDVVTKHELDVANIESGRSEADRNASARKEVATNALTELGSLGRALVFAKAGIPPEYHGLMDVLSASPDLAATIKDPRVQSMLKKPENVATLTNILRAAAEQDAAGNPEAPADAPAEPEPAA